MNRYLQRQAPELAQGRIDRSGATTRRRRHGVRGSPCRSVVGYLTSDVRERRTLEALNLPAALEALEKPVGLPPSLLQKAEVVRAEDGPARIEASIENVQKLAQRDMDILNEVGHRPQPLGTACDSTSPTGYGHS